MKQRIICVAGPTASGKTALAVALAKALDGEVVSCDSMQIYRGMDIGTAKPTREEREGIPHHMLDVADPAESFSVGQYVALADPIVQDILRRGKTAIIAGGTGLYMDSLIAGRDFAPRPSTGKREILETLAREQGIEAVLAKLRQVDPDSAARLHPSDHRRIIRAMEVYQETGVTITQHNAQTRRRPPRYRPLWLGITFAQREELYRRIDRRVEEMMTQGLAQEVRGLLAGGLSPQATAMQAIGYKEMAQALAGEISLAAAVERIQQGSRRYAKRQLTWLRRNPDIHWLVRQGEEEIVSLAMAAVDKSSNFDKA